MKKPKSPNLIALLRCIREASFLEKNKETTDLSAFQEAKNSYDASRRAFLRNSMNTLVGVGISSMYLSSCKSITLGKLATDNNLKIAIVGGGIAGLHCAYVLQKAGIYSTIYEGSSRIGGRIFTKSDVFGENITTEFGGEFIDSDHTDMLQLINEFGIEILDTHDDYEDSDITKGAFYFSNRHYSESEVIDEFRGIVAGLEVDKQSIGENYETPFCEKIDNVSLEEYVRKLDCSNWLKDLIIYAFTAEFGLDAGEQSSLNFIDMISVDTSDGFKIFGESDERFKLKGGNKMVIEGLTEKVKEQIKTEYNLTSIRSKSNSYTLAFENGEEINADFVVLTIPFSVLREIDIDIKGMPSEKLNCINQLGYGQNNKLILGFNGRPWRENGNTYAGYLFNKQIQNGWDSGHMQNNNRGASGYTIYLGGSESLDLSKSARELNQKDKVSENLAQKYLLQLEEVFPGAKTSFSGNHSAALWSNNPFVKGSYACYKVGQWTSLSGHEFEPVGNVYFAGEHCSENFQGYMNGGAETGRQVAEVLIKKIA